MIELWLHSLPLLLLFGALGWVHAYRQHNVNIVDSMWSLFFLVATLVYVLAADVVGPAGWLLLVFVTLWGLRLATHLAVRNAGKDEDRRYAAMRERNPAFAKQSLVTVFGLQAVLAWFLSAPLASAIANPVDLGPLHALAATLFVVGLLFEAIADWQLVRFKRDPANRGQVLDTGLWGLSRHPNYFGEAVVWWGFFVFALAAGDAWTVIAPVLMTFLLLRVSGVTMLERDIGERRPGYRAYIERTSAFIPWFPRSTPRGQHPKEDHS
jgi:steroid 5-alpha reductase family enzyme